MSTRFTYIAGFSVVTLLLLSSIFLQYFAHINPCPLCILQRITLGFMGGLFLLGIFIPGKKGGRCVINFLVLVASLLGIFLAGRQTWLQHFPSADGSECGVSLQYMMQVLPLNEVVQKIFQGSAECSQQDWLILHLSMAEWALISFIAFFFFSLYLLRRK